MNINELFLSLAGFESASEDELLETDNPTVHQLLSKTNAFSKSLRAIRRATSVSQDHPICEVIKNRVELEYLNQLSQLESKTITRLASQPPIKSLPDLLLVTTDVIAQIVDPWEPLIRFTIDCLQKLTQPRTIQVVTIEQECLSYAGDNRIFSLSQSFLEAMDRCWAADLCSEFSQCGYKFDIQQLAHHPQIRDPDVVLEAYAAMNKIQEAADVDSDVLARMFTLIDENNLLFKNLEVPFRSATLNRTLQQVYDNINLVVREKLLKSDRVSQLLSAIRDVALFGSIEITSTYDDVEGNIREIISAYQEPRGIDVLDYDLDTQWLTVKRDHLTTFVVNDAQWSLIFRISTWMAHIHSVIPRIRMGSGPISHAYRLLFESIWAESQRSIDDMFNELRSVIDSDKSMNIRFALDNGLKKLIGKLMLDNPTYRQQMKNAMRRCTSNDPLPLITLIDTLEQIGAHNIDLLPFKTYFQESMGNPE